MSEWVTGPALQTILTLEGLQRGDELQCSVCSKIHVFVRYGVGDQYEIITSDGDDVTIGLSADDIGAWRRP